MECPFPHKRTGSRASRALSFLFSVLLWAPCGRSFGANAIPVENQGFEVDYDKDLFPDGWEVQDEATLALREQSLEGSWCAALQPLSGKERARIRSSSFPLKPGKMYVVSAWKRSLKEIPVGLSLELVDEAGEPLAAWTSRSISTLFWSPLKLLVASPNRASLARIVLEVGRTGSREGSAVYWDRCEIAEAVPWKASSGEEWRPVDLSDHANRGWEDEDLEDLASFPRGGIRMARVPFDLPTEGKAFLVVGGDDENVSASRASLPLDLRARTLYFLHCTQGSEQLGAKIGTYEILFSDGQREEIPIRFDREIGSFKHPHGAVQGPLVWFGESRIDWPVGVNVMPWENPRPDVSLRSLTVESLSQEAPLLLLGLTAFDGPNLFRSDLVQSLGAAEETWLPARLGPWDDSTVLRGAESRSAPGIAPPLRNEFGVLADEQGDPVRLFGASLRIDPESANMESLTPILLDLSSAGCNLLRLRSSSRWTEGSLPLLTAILEQAGNEDILLCLSPFPPIQGNEDALRFWMGDKRLHKESRGHARWLKGALKSGDALHDIALWVVDTPSLFDAVTAEDRGILLEKWNRWLRKRYKDRGRLYDAWSSSSGQSALKEGEDPAEGTVAFPDRIQSADDVLLYGAGGDRRKYRDSLLFLKECAEDAGKRIQKWSAGLSDKAPVVWLGHPYETYGALSLPDGVLQGVLLSGGDGNGWPGWSAGHLHCMGVPAADPFLPPLTQAGTPTVVEMPGEGFLRTGAPQTLARAAYGAFHGWDVLLVDIGPAPANGKEGVVFEEAPFLPACASLFLRGDVKQSVRRAEVSVLSPPRASGWWLEGWARGWADSGNLIAPITVSSGPSFEEMHLDRCILLRWGDHLAEKPGRATSSRQLLFLETVLEDATPGTASHWVKSLHPEMELLRPPSLSLSLPGAGLLGQGGGPFVMDSPLCMKTSALPKWALTLGNAPEEDLCLGAIAGQWAVLTGNAGLRQRKRSPELLFFLEALHEWGLTEEDAKAVERHHVFRSLGGELEMDSAQGVFRVQTPNTSLIAGRLVEEEPYTVGPLEVVPEASPCAAVLTRIGDPLDPGRERRWLLTACGKTGTRKGNAFRMDVPLDPASRCPSWISPDESTQGWKIEPFRGILRFEGLLSKGQLHVFPVLGDGSRGDALELEATATGGFFLHLEGQTSSVFFELILDQSFGILARK